MRTDQTILIVEDELEARSYCETVVRSLGYATEVAANGPEAMFALNSNPWISLVLLDLNLATLRDIRNAGRTQPVIIVSGAAPTETVVQAIKAGATDFLTKPVGQDALHAAIAGALNHRPAGPPPADSTVSLNPNWIGPEIQSVWRRVAASDVPLLIEGETGAGKEVLARQIHAHSPRAAKPFLKLNCAALPGELIESELFGYERGAFTGAFNSKPGKFELAQGGTILLDEIGDMDFRLQAKLLHVLQDKECERLGGKDRIALDVRVMAATHCDLMQAIDDGRFRADLYYRLNVVNLRVPALRHRKAGIESAAEFFLRKHGGDDATLALLTPPLRQAMLDYEWPGNLRELENMMRRLMVIQDPAELAQQLRAAPQQTRESLPEGVIRFHPAGAGTSTGSPILEKVNEAKRKAEAEAILRALDASHWNRKQAAKILRVDYKALLYKMRKLDIDNSAATLRTAAGGA